MGSLSCFLEGCCKNIFAQLKSCVYICNLRVAQLIIENETRYISGHIRPNTQGYFNFNRYPGINTKCNGGKI